MDLTRMMNVAPKGRTAGKKNSKTRPRVHRPDLHAQLKEFVRVNAEQKRLAAEKDALRAELMEALGDEPNQACKRTGFNATVEVQTGDDEVYHYTRKNAYSKTNIQDPETHKVLANLLWQHHLEDQESLLEQHGDYQTAINALIDTYFKGDIAITLNTTAYESEDSEVAKAIQTLLPYLQFSLNAVPKPTFHQNAVMDERTRSLMMSLQDEGVVTPQSPTIKLAE